MRCGIEVYSYHVQCSKARVYWFHSKAKRVYYASGFIGCRRDRGVSRSCVLQHKRVKVDICKAQVYWFNRVAKRGVLYESVFMGCGRDRGEFISSVVQHKMVMYNVCMDQMCWFNSKAKSDLYESGFMGCRRDVCVFISGASEAVLPGGRTKVTILGSLRLPHHLFPKTRKKISLVVMSTQIHSTEEWSDCNQGHQAGPRRAQNSENRIRKLCLKTVLRRCNEKFVCLARKIEPLTLRVTSGRASGPKPPTTTPRLNR